MQQITYYCELCKNKLDKKDCKKINLEFWHNAWENRKNYFDFVNEDICDSCFDKYQKLIKSLIDFCRGNNDK
jgi:CRISPR/Cas system-associated protein Cas10 (large subunit of type III CRISPR-Cas system)